MLLGHRICAFLLAVSLLIPTALPVGAAPAPVFVLVDGLNSSTDTWQEDFGPLLKRLRAAGVDDGSVLEYSYTTGVWQGSNWIPSRYGSADTQQGLGSSTAELRALIRGIHARNPGTPVRVFGFSEGGLVALQEVAEAAADGDRAGLPDRAAALSSPLGGVDLRTKCGMLTSISDATALTTLVGVATGGLGWLGLLGGMGAANYAAGQCPGGPITGDLQYMDDTAVWRQARDANLATAQATYGVQLATFAHAGDCVYDVDLCMPGMGDTDDRWSNHLSIAVQDQTYPALRSYSGAFDVRKSHSEPLQADFVLRDVVTFLANQPAAAMGAAPATPPTMAATPTASRYDYSSWIDAGADYWLEVRLQAGQRLDVTFGVSNADQKIDAWITGPTSGPSVASRTYQASGQMSLPPVSVDGIYEVRWSNARSMFRGRGITATLIITGP